MEKSWDPDVYLSYQAYRARPAFDLMKQIKLDIDGNIVDLGCGPGNVTKHLKDTWPNRVVTGVDKSETMLARARDSYPEISWEKGDIATWTAEQPMALIFSNAALHWLSNHHQVLPRLLRSVKTGGWLAFQIPVTEESEYQKCIQATVNSRRWSNRLANVWTYKNPMDPNYYYDLLTNDSTSIDIWMTDYHHILEGQNPVADWIMGTGLTPYLAVLNKAEQTNFISDYKQRVLAAYPKHANGKTLFLMKRIFVLAQKA
ncbi:MAG: methyltransferase domain-containing protein [Rhodospirillaceae bacterium]